MVERKKLIKGPVYFDGPLNLLPHYNKSQIITCTCEVCGKQFDIMFQNLKKKKEISCKSCAVKLHTPFSEIGKKVSKTHIAKIASMTEQEYYDRFVAPQVNRSEKAKQESIRKYQQTIHSKSQEERDAMKSKIKAAKAAMTDEQRKERERKFLKSYYESQGDKILSHAEMFLNSRNIKHNYEGDFVFECECDKCKKDYKWSPISSSEYNTQKPHCPNCYQDIKSSFEYEICEMLDSLQIEYVHSDRSVIKPKELDIYIPSEKIAIEFDGIHWHKDSTKTLEKSKLCESLGIRLINIFENEFDYIKVNSILQSTFKKSKIVYARNCVIKNLDNDDYKNFCNDNHIQNYEAANVRLGLLYNNTLIQVMSFSKSRFNKKYQWEIIRECSKCGYGVVGGKERLFKHFIKTYSPNSIISYCDKRWFTGASYLNIGMTQLQDTKPSYVYIKGNDVKSRYMCQKQNLRKWLPKFDEQLSQYENMIMNGYSRMYDFGQHTFVWNTTF